MRNAIALIPTSSLPGNSIKTILLGHTDLVTSLRWLQLTLDKELLVSSSSNGHVLVWSLDDSFTTPLLNLSSKMALSSCDGVWFSRPDILCVAASASASDQVYYWDISLKQHSLEEVQGQLLTLPSSIQRVHASNLFSLILTVRMSYLTDEKQSSLLALGTDIGAIYLYYKQDNVNTVGWNYTACLQGHEDWVRCLDFHNVTSNGRAFHYMSANESTPEAACFLLLCSTSQDKTVRIWRFVANPLKVDGPVVANDIKMKPIELKDVWVKSLSVSVWSDAVLSGHEMWVYSGTWLDSVHTDHLELVTASWDKSVCIWQLQVGEEEGSHIWTEVARLGQVGGNALGLYDAVFSRDGLYLAAHGYQGSLFLWRRPSLTSTEWTAESLTSGHFAPVESLCWESSRLGGQYLLSVSQDQTTRLYAFTECYDTYSWRELGRPQIHGYNINCIASLGFTKFASAADEMVVRVFIAPRSFIDTCQRLVKVTDADFLDREKETSLPEGASVPALGLSNKAIFCGDNAHNATPPAPGDDMHDLLTSGGNYDKDFNLFRVKTYTSPPTEDDLAQNTLWPEVKKLYGHAYEIFSIAAHPQGTLLASASKASQQKHASILLWKASDWTLIQRLTMHKLTVVQMQFSHCGCYLLAVSRDRHWSLWSTTASPNEFSYSLHSSSLKSSSVHSRIIWACAWAPDDKYFFTASRDKTVRVWTMSTLSSMETRSDSSLACGAIIPLDDAVTAVDCTWLSIDPNDYLLACGMENGRIHLMKWNPLLAGSTTLRVLSNQEAHHAVVRSLRFQPCAGDQSQKNNELSIILASAGDDTLVRLYHLTTANK